MSSGTQARSLKERWADGESTLGAWCMMPGALGVESVGSLGFDWVLIDMQHGCMDFEGALEMIRAADLHGMAPIVRVPWNEPGIIGRVLDAGALGILVPMIQDARDAERMVEACLYPPAGRRSFGPIRVNTRDGVGYFLTANERVAVIPMIETREALENVEAIAATPGVDALFVGPFDLSIALGLMPGDNDGESVFDDAIDKIVAAARKHGRALAVLSNAEVAPLRLKQGFQMVSVSTDSNALVASSAASLAAVRERVAKELSDAE